MTRTTRIRIRTWRRGPRRADGSANLLVGAESKTKREELDMDGNDEESVFDAVLPLLEDGFDGWRTAGELAEESGYSVPVIRKRLAGLKASGRLEVSRRPAERVDGLITTVPF